MKQFIARHREKILGVLSGWDRLSLEGMLVRGRLNTVQGMQYYLNTAGVLLKDFGRHAKSLTQQLLWASTAKAKQEGRPVRYLPSSKTRKAVVAQGLLEQYPVEQGLICVLRCVEPGLTFTVRGNRQTKKLHLVRDWGKCLHLYHYYLDPVFGFTYVRLQTWFPFMIRVGINGREWLAQRMREQGVSYRRSDNCFPWIEDFPRAQEMLGALLKVNWPKHLDRFARLINPIQASLFHPLPASYYWTIDQSEWATDIVFDSHESLAAIYPQLTLGAINGFASQEVMRFLGKRPDARFQGELISDYRMRPEGLRVKHAMDANSIKMYDKAASILRIETTITNPRPFQVYRPKQGDEEKNKQWLRMRNGVADQHRRAQVSQNANERYLNALSALDTSQRLEQLVQPITCPVKQGRTTIRGLHPWNRPDQALLEFINRPEHQLAGFRNRDLVQAFYPEATTPKEKRNAAARISYRLRILRAHGLIAKLPKVRRYRITPKAHQVITAILLAQNATIQQLAKAVA
jgi:hypothetical protein